MVNKLILQGRLVADPELRQTTELTVERAHFAGSKADGIGASYQPNVSGADFTEMNGDDGDLPF